MSTAQVFRKGMRRFWLATLAVAFLGVVMTPKVEAVTATPNFEQNVSRNGGWAKTTTASPSTGVNFLLTYHNLTNSTQRVTLKDTLPAKLPLLPGSAYLFNPAHPNGVKQADVLTSTGIRSGVLNPGDTAYIQFMVTTPAAANLACGDTLFISRGSATVIGGSNSYESNARVTVHRDCAAAPVQQPQYSCDTVTFSVGANRRVSAASFSYTAKNGAAFKSTDVNWGDGSAVRPVLTAADSSHTYAKDGTYVITVVVHFTVNNQDVTSNCVATVHVSTPAATPSTTTTSTPTTPTHAVQGAQTAAATTTAQPTTLVNTGASSVWGIALAVAFVGAAARYVLLRRATRLSSFNNW